MVWVLIPMCRRVGTPGYGSDDDGYDDDSDDHADPL